MNELTVPAAATAIAPAELTIDQLVARVEKVREAIRSVMIPGQDLITIPGVAKPVAGKSFAEKMSLLFMFAPSFATRVDKDGEHREVFVTCTLTHAPTGAVVATCDASCSTMESKYRWRNADRKCPKCGAASIIKGKADYGGGFLCFAKKGGCGAKFSDSDPAIIGQTTGRVENPDIADAYNTVSKMAQKRAYVGAVLLASGASDIVTQDLDENVQSDDYAPPTANADPTRESMMPRESAPPDDDTAGLLEVGISAVDVATGSTKAGKPWTRYGVTLAMPDGSTMLVGTFSATVGGAAQAAIGKRARVAVTSRDANGKTFHDLTECRPV